MGGFSVNLNVQRYERKRIWTKKGVRMDRTAVHFVPADRSVNLVRATSSEGACFRSLDINNERSWFYRGF